LSKKYHRFFISKNGVNIKHIREETGAQIHIPSEGTEKIASSDSIRIEGSYQSVVKAKYELETMIKKIIEKKMNCRKI
jgi:polyribonucleotide nucleotidyltransferase